MYFLLEDSSRPRRWIGKSPFVKGVSWWRGAVIATPIPDPLEYTLKPYHPSSPDEDQYMGVFIETNPPLWRDDFIQALRECGVYNFDTYNVAITNPDNTPIIHAFYQDLRDGGITDVAAYMRKIGVDDLNAWIDPNPGLIYTNYKAVNILGLVAAADMSKSIATVHDGIPLIDVDFDELVIDEKKTRGIKMFRLAESTNAILVHESLRDALIAKGFGSDLAFYDLKEAAI
jgi:hypothetical protein